MELLLLYWFVTTMIAIGIIYNREEGFSVNDAILCALSGWFMAPIKIGALIGHLHKD